LRLIVFDCDGTLIDSQHLIVEAMGAAFAANGLPAPPRSSVLRVVGLSVAEAMAAISESLDGRLITNLAASYRTAFAALRQKPDFTEPLYPGARTAIEELAVDPAILLGIATGKSRRGVDTFLAREDLAGRFATLQTADTSPSKPHPDMLLRVMEETGAQPHDTVMVGDATYDIEMARNAGLSAIGVAWGYHGPGELLAAGASAVAEDFAQLLAMLRESGMVAAA
jgi:phosphoglycolate phosphatase